MRRYFSHVAARMIFCKDDRESKVYNVVKTNSSLQQTAILWEFYMIFATRAHIKEFGADDFITSDSTFVAISVSQ